MVALSDFLSIMTTFTKIVLLINRIDERKVLLSMYNVVYAKINGQSDSNVAKYAKKIYILIIFQSAAIVCRLRKALCQITRSVLCHSKPCGTSATRCLGMYTIQNIYVIGILWTWWFCLLVQQETFGIIVRAWPYPIPIYWTNLFWFDVPWKD